MPDKKKILLYFIHPAAHKSRVNSEMLEAVKDMEGVTVRALYELYPDYYIDIKKEQALFQEYDILVWQHPFYWYSAPSLLKEWIDLVLEHGFAYGHDGRAAEGKWVLTATSTGGQRNAYQVDGRNHFTMRQLLAPYEQTCNLCRMKYLPPFVAHGSLLMEQKDLESIAKDYKNILTALRNGDFSEKQLSEAEYINDLIR